MKHRSLICEGVGLANFLPQMDVAKDGCLSQTEVDERVNA